MLPEDQDKFFLFDNVKPFFKVILPHVLVEKRLGCHALLPLLLDLNCFSVTVAFNTILSLTLLVFFTNEVYKVNPFLGFLRLK